MALPGNCVAVTDKGVCTACEDGYALNAKGECCPVTTGNGNNGNHKGGVGSGNGGKGNNNGNVGGRNNGDHGNDVGTVDNEDCDEDNVV